MQAELFEFEDGQAIGAPFREPTVRNSERTLSFAYDTPDTLIVNLNGQREVILQRFLFQ